MSITSRPYTSIDDLHKIQSATADWITVAGFSGYLHFGDISLRLFNGMRAYQPPDIIRLWENEHGKLLAWAIVYPSWDSFDVLTDPNLRGNGLEAEALDWAESELQGWFRKENRLYTPIILEITRGHNSRIKLLETRGYSHSEEKGSELISERSLDDPIPTPILPGGFRVREFRDGHEAANLVEVMNAAFGWSWTADEYVRVVRSPAYHTGYKLVIEAAYGRFVAFCFVMLDTVNALGMFEDVGTHPDFRRLGLGRALLYAGMHRMKEAGMKSVLVPHIASVIPAVRLYESVGFRPKYWIDHYVKQEK